MIETHFSRRAGTQRRALTRFLLEKRDVLIAANAGPRATDRLLPMNSIVSAIFRSVHSTGAFLLLLVFGSAVAHGEVVTDWNVAFAQYTAAPELALAPQLEARVHAMAHLAIVEAIAEVRRGSRRGSESALADRAAAVEAAKSMIAALLPEYASRAEALAAEQLAALPEGNDKARGLASGRAVAARVLRARAADGWIALTMSHPPYGPLPDRSEELARAIADGAAPPRSPWRSVRPFFLKSAGQLEPAVPSFTAVDGSVRVDYDLLQSKLFNAVDRTNAPDVLPRTWDASPVVAWNRIARAAIAGRGLTLAEEARVFALLNLALADAALSALHWRFTLGSWSDMFIETWADGRGRPMSPSATTAPAVFDSFQSGTAVLETRRVLVPPRPNYPSLAATLGGAAQAALIAGLKFDHGGFTLEVTNRDAPTLSRSFGSIAEAARECAFVATLDGRHTREAGIAGYQFGAAIGREVARRFDRARR